MTNITEIVEEFVQRMMQRYYYAHEGTKQEMKDWLTTTLTTLEATHQQELEKNISFLRQWLNEDRITDPQKMVTNEDLEYWLNKK